MLHGTKLFIFQIFFYVLPDRNFEKREMNKEETIPKWMLNNKTKLSTFLEQSMETQSLFAVIVAFYRIT